MKRANLAKAIYDLGKLSFAALVLGPIVSTESFHGWLVIGGIACTTMAFTSAWLLDQGD